MVTTPEQLTSGRGFARGGGVRDWVVSDFKFFLLWIWRGILTLHGQQLWTRLLSSQSCSKNFPHLRRPKVKEGVNQDERTGGTMRTQFGGSSIRGEPLPITHACADSVTAFVILLT